MYFVHRVLVSGLVLSLAAPVLAGRAPVAAMRAPAKSAQQKKVVATLGSPPKARRVRFPYGSALDRLASSEFQTVKSLLGELDRGTLQTSFVDGAHTVAVDRVDLNPKYRAYNLEAQSAARGRGASFDFEASDHAIFAKHFAGTGLVGWRDVEGMTVSERESYPVRREAPARQTSSYVHAAVTDLARATKDGEAKTMLTKALGDPLTLALVMQVGANAERLASSYHTLTPRQAAARTIYDGVAKIMQAQDREQHGAGLAFLDKGRDPLFQFKVSRMWSDTTSRGNEIALLPRERVMSAARGVLTKADLNDAIIGLDL